MSFILWYPQLNVGTLDVSVKSIGPSLTSKDHSHEHSVIPAILKRGYYRPQVNVRSCQHIQVHLASFMLEHHFHPIIYVALSSLPIFWGDPYYQSSPPLFEDGLCLRPVLPFRGESISLTCSSFPKRVHIFIVPPCKESL